MRHHDFKIENLGHLIAIEHSRQPTSCTLIGTELAVSTYSKGGRNLGRPIVLIIVKGSMGTTRVRGGF